MDRRRRLERRRNLGFAPFEDQPGSDLRRPLPDGGAARDGRALRTLSGRDRRRLLDRRRDPRHRSDRRRARRYGTVLRLDACRSGRRGAREHAILRGHRRAARARARGERSRPPRGFRRRHRSERQRAGSRARGGYRPESRSLADSLETATRFAETLVRCGTPWRAGSRRRRLLWRPSSVGHGTLGGWDPFGPERRITRSLGNVLFELDSRPALELYRLYLGEHAAGLPATGLLFPLSLRSGEGETGLVRTIVGIIEGRGSLTFVGDVPEGQLARLMRANLDRLDRRRHGSRGEDPLRPWKSPLRSSHS